ncbi:MAG: [protein-PII] uridylyltransferase [Paracoccaceae bacterium]
MAVKERMVTIDAAALRHDLECLAKRETDRGKIRQGAFDLLRSALVRGRDAIDARLRADPYCALDAIKAYTDLADTIVGQTFEVARRWLHPIANPTAGQRICVLAVGGYGRAEMAPFSDVDLLFLTPYKQTAWGESVIESVLYILWDLKMKVGHAVRTVDDCIRLGRDDITIRTALLEHRYLSGERALAEELEDRLWRELFEKTGPGFVEAKLAEREARHSRHGGSRYLVEPNVKEGKGGLRDLQTLFWIAKYLNHAKAPRDLVKIGVFTAEEFRIFSTAEAFLWTVRCQLHLVSGRPNEQMTFDTQVEIAKALGFKDKAGQRGVERFMQTYFTHARHVGELTRIFLVALEAQHVKRRPNLGRSILNAFSSRRSRVPEGYTLRHGRMDIADPEAFLKVPINILKLFQHALETGILIHPNAMRLVASNLDLIDDELRQSPEANRIFLATLLDHGNPERALRRMNELGVLGRFIPEFGRVVAMMQFNMYHHYTVDEHTIECVSILNRIEGGQLVEELPIASAILQQGINRRVIYVALLLHDLGKGSPKDHSILGAEVARRLCPRLGLDAHESETVGWLVRNHLLMSDTAQKRDVGDPRNVKGFAETVQSPNRLKLLTVLTVCDIMGVGPGVWNNWKAVLLRELYAQTMDILTDGSATQTRKDREAEAKEELARALPDWSREDIETEQARHYAPYWLGLDTATHVEFAKLGKEAATVSIAHRIEPDDSRDATRACFMLQDHPGLFARLAGSLALSGANVVDARTYTSADGYATAVFWIQDSQRRPYEKSRLSRLRRTIQRTLKGEVIPREALKTRDKVRKRERDFIVPTAIAFDNEGSDIYTIIEVDTRDRPGLLHDLARALSDANVSIASAIIATYGEQAVDVFYVKDPFGLKIHGKSKQASIEKKLSAAISRGAENMIA